MRISHLALRRRIESEKASLSDQDLFASHAFSAYLTDLAEAATKRYHRVPVVSCVWEEQEDAPIAYTNSRRICVNAANVVTQSLPTRQLRCDSLIGLTTHEIGHILFTDFQMVKLYTGAMRNGRMYPSEPPGLSPTEEIYLSELKELYQDRDSIGVKVLLQAAHLLYNILEDMYIEARMMDAYPGTFRTGILLFNFRVVEYSPSIVEQLKKNVPEDVILFNLITQYGIAGDIENPEGYSGPLLDAFYACIPVIDNAAYDDDSRQRFAAVNLLLIKLWPYIKQRIARAEESLQSGQTQDEILAAMEEQSSPKAEAPEGEGKPIQASAIHYDPAQARKEQKHARQVYAHETGRILPEKTDTITEGSGGTTVRDDSYTGAGYASSGADIARLLNQAAEEHVSCSLNEELEQDLQAESDKIRYGDAHKGVDITIHRMSVLPAGLAEAYREVAPPLLRLSKRLQAQVADLWEQKRQGGKVSGLLNGRRMNARAFVREDGGIFYKNILPDGQPTIAVGLLVDESGSMDRKDRITAARAASLILYDFCRAMGLAVAVYGHSTNDAKRDGVDLYAYAEFDREDGQDRYRIMDMSARSGNRDGAALRFVAERLCSREEDTRLLILISDGRPACTGYYGTEAEADLRGIKQEYTRKGITMIAAAIGDDKPNIERIYKDGFLDITDLNHLPANLVNVLIQYMI